MRTKYAEALKCTFLDEAGKSQVMEMGCYGIGVTRIVGAAESRATMNVASFSRSHRPVRSVYRPNGLHQE